MVNQIESSSSQVDSRIIKVVHWTNAVYRSFTTVHLP